MAISGGNDDSNAPKAESGAKAEAAVTADAPPTAEVACARDWRKCEDNVAIANDIGWWGRIARQCKAAADGMARYGTPIWPAAPFDDIVRGKSYLTTGIAVAIEPDALFENAFGTKVHTRLVCKYDLSTWKVIDIRSADRD